MAQDIIAQPPLNCGQRLIPSLVDEIAASDPQRVFVSVPRTSNVADGFDDISYAAFANAVNRFAWILEAKLTAEEKGRTLLYIGPLDIRYLVILLAACKTGHIAFFSSHRNSLEAHLSLLEKTNCNTVLLPDHAPSIIKQILGERSMDSIHVPELSDIMDSVNQEAVYTFQRTFEEMRHQPFVILHTSGSTGIPKPVYVTHGTFASNDAYQLIPSLGGKPTIANYIQQKRLFLGFPLFHAANLTFTIGFSVFTGVICVLPPPEKLSIETVNACHIHGNLDGSLLPPSVIIDIYKSSENYFSEMLKHIKFLMYVGGTLPTEIGASVSTHIKLFTLMGSTETMMFPLELERDDVDWQYLSPSKFFGYELQLNRDGLQEIVLVRNKQYDLFQGVFSTFTSIDEYHTNDLYKPHPTNPNMWAFAARADDLITFNNSEKLNPVTMETLISGDPKVRSAIISGNGEFQASLLIEPIDQPESAQEREKLLQEIWPVIRQANQGCPAHGRIMKDFVIFTSPDKPLPRAGKETVQRYAALALYESEFKALYSEEPSIDEPTIPLPANENITNGHTSNGASPANMIFSDNPVPQITGKELESHIEAVLVRVLPDILQKQLRAALAEVAMKFLHPESLTQIGWGSIGEKTVAHSNSSSSTVDTQPSLNMKEVLYEILADNAYLVELSDTANLFESGLDSLQMPVLVKEINSFLSQHKPGAEPVNVRIFHENPTLAQLTVALEAR